MRPRRKFVKKDFTEANFSNLVYRKLMSEIDFVGKTRYEDLTETGS